jgi:hypothetical protein
MRAQARGGDPVASGWGAEERETARCVDAGLNS